MLHIGFIYKEKKDLKKGIQFAKKLLKENSGIPEFYDMLATFYEQKKNFKEALKVVANGLKQYPKDEKLLYFQGALFDKIGDRKRGIANMRKILETKLPLHQIS